MKETVAAVQALLGEMQTQLPAKVKKAILAVARNSPKKKKLKSVCLPLHSNTHTHTQKKRIL